MTSATIYLHSYDRYAEILEMDLARGKLRVLDRAEFEPLGVPDTSGVFTREGADVYGVFASPEGPVFFKNNIACVGRFGRVKAELGVDKRSGLRRFALWDGETPVFDALYVERLGIGTTPYDNSEEDVDLFALMASHVKNPQFFENYTPERMRAARAAFAADAEHAAAACATRRTHAAGRAPGSPDGSRR